jgi:hypothetical protein
VVILEKRLGDAVIRDLGTWRKRDMGEKGLGD